MEILFKVSNTGGKPATVANSNFREHYATVNANMAWQTLEPSIKTATRERLIPVISDEFYAALADKYVDSAELTDEETEILALCQDVVAFHAILMLSPELNIGVSDMGMVEKGSNQAPVYPAAQWRYKEFKYELTKKADKALDRLVAKLDEYVIAALEEFDLYKESKAYTQNRSSFFVSASQFNKYVQIGNSKRLFDELLLDIANAEEDIDKIIGEEQFNALVVVIKDGSESDEEKALLEKIRRYVAVKAVSRCMPRLFLTKDTHGLSLSSYTDGFNTHNSLSVSTQAAQVVDAYIITLKADVDMFFKDLVNFIYDNIADYDLIAASDNYVNYTAETTTPICTGYGGIMI